MFSTARIVCASLLLVSGTAASADPWKDESGKSRERYEDRRGDYERGDRYRHRDDRYRDRDDRYRDDDDRYRNRDRRYGRNAIPRGHRPPPGMCRVWFYDRPAGHQPPPTSCRQAKRQADRYGGDVIWGRRR